jgi:16S rRNA (uracil1498-N3)-methyltransferase
MRREGGKSSKFQSTDNRFNSLMPSVDFRTPRIYLDAALAGGEAVSFDRDQANYLRNVLRLGQGDDVLLFNGRDGEWAAKLALTGKRALSATVGECLRPQPAPLDLHFLFAPLKHARLDYLVQKAVEMGASRLQPVITRHTQVARVNVERMRANAIEAAQQCGVLCLPEIKEPVTFRTIAGSADAGRLLVFCDENAEVKDPVAALAQARPQAVALLPAETAGNATPLAVLIGPEGGFAEDEREALRKRPNVVRIALGPRILRADTAAVAALALIQAVLGDWN